MWQRGGGGPARLLGKGRGKTVWDCVKNMLNLGLLCGREGEGARHGCCEKGGAERFGTV